MQFDDLNNAKPLFADWQHWVPFAALMVRESVPANRPMTTRIIEQAFVAAIAGGGSAYGVSNSPRRCTTGIAGSDMPGIQFFQ